VIAAMRCDELLDACDYEDARTYQAIKRGQTGPAAPRRTWHAEAGPQPRSFTLSRPAARDPVWTALR